MVPSLKTRGREERVCDRVMMGDRGGGTREICSVSKGAEEEEDEVSSGWVGEVMGWERSGL